MGIDDPCSIPHQFSSHRVSPDGDKPTISDGSGFDNRRSTINRENAAVEHHKLRRLLSPLHDLAGDDEIASRNQDIDHCMFHLDSGCG